MISLFRFSRMTAKSRLLRPVRLLYFVLFLTIPGLSASQEHTPYQPRETVQATAVIITEFYPAVGTVKPRSETLISSQIDAQVRQLHVKAGQTVARGDLLVSLDNRQLTARLASARQALEAARAGREKAAQSIKSAEAAFDNARLKYDRIKSYYASEAATLQEMENAEAEYLQARAGVSMAKEALTQAEAGIRQAEQAVKDSSVGFQFSQLTAPTDGEIIRVLVEPGDLAMPGKPLVALRTQSGFRIEAHVREGLISKVSPGIQLKAEIPTLNKTVDAQVEEIIPYADPDTRTFLIKAAIPHINGIYPGMYAKLQVPEADTRAVMIPSEAIVRAGQLDLVMVKADGMWQRRFIKTGKPRGNQSEILSGIQENEIIGIGEVK